MRTLLIRSPSLAYSVAKWRGSSVTGTFSNFGAFQEQNLIGNERRSFSSSETVVKPEVDPTYYVPREKRTVPNQVFQFASKDGFRLARPHRSAVSKEINYTPELWQRHKSPWRKFRHLNTVWGSSTFQRLAYPDLAFTASVAVGVSYYNYFLAEAGSLLVIDGSAMAGASTAIGLLAGFRLNSCYGRYDEGRKFWGEINNSSRDLAGNALMWLDTQEQVDRMLKLIKAFPVAMNFHLNRKGGHQMMNSTDPDFDKRKYAEYYSEMLDIYKDETDHDFVRICNTFHSGGHVPLLVTSTMRNVIAENKEDGAEAQYLREMDEQVQRLVACMGQCERVLRTPIPTSFNRHISRLFFVWSNSLPFTMYASCGPIGTLPGTMLVAYAVLGIADIGVQLEEPFNVLPMRQYSDGIYDGINSIESSYIAARQNLMASGVGLAASMNPATLELPNSTESKEEQTKVSGSSFSRSDVDGEDVPDYSDRRIAA